MAVYSSYDQIGIMEDVSSIVTTISPSDTPFSALIKSEKVHNRLFEWQEDTLRAGQSNAKVEGAAFAAGTQTPTVMRSNVTQILNTTFEVSATADAIKTHGRAAETAYQLSKVLKEIKKDLEFAYVGTSNAAVSGSSSVAREMASATEMITTDTVVTGALTEAALLDLAEDCYNNGSDPSLFMIKPADSLVTAGFAASAGRNRTFNDGTKSVVNAVDLYISPFGEYRIILNRHQLTTHAFLIDPSMWRSVVLRPFSRTLLGKVSDGDTHAVTGEYSLKHMNFAADGMLSALT